MNPEQARALRDRLAPRPAGLAVRRGSRRRQTLRFDRRRPEQAREALALLSGIERLEVLEGAHPNSLRIAYTVTDYTLQGIESALVSLGFCFDDNLFWRFMRALAHFSEETELRNLSVPERLIKQSNEVYAKAWEHHPHGDHDDTPPELREYK